MVVTKEEVRNILATLPIGLYAKRRIGLDLSDDPTSYYSPMEDSIVVSYPIVAVGLENAIEDENYTKEVAIRSMLYHEVSHAILTSNELQVNDIMNIFEDERIETILKDYYLDVDFKRQTLYCNGGKIAPATDTLTAFYNLVRFRSCSDQSFLDRVDEIIKDYSYLNSSSGWWDCRKYRNAVERLYHDFREMCEENGIPNTSDEDRQNLENEYRQDNENSDDFGNSGHGGQREKLKKNNESGKEDGESNGQGGDHLSGESDGEDSQGASLTNEVTKENCGSERDGQASKGGGINDIFAQAINSYVDSNLTNALETIISQFNKKNKGGCGTTSYSGVINPRLVGNSDYRWFERSLSVNGNNKFGTMHLNLFIDCSGSFSPNEDRVNTLIYSLTQIENKNKNFTFDIIFCGHGLTETTKKTRKLNANSGNSLHYDQVREVYNKHQKKNTMNYNIVLFDGDCGPYDGYSKKANGRKNALKVFDNSNCTLILERDNMGYVKDFKSGKVIPCNENYSEVLTDHVIKALNIAFR